MSKSFTGFSAGTYGFMRDLAENNNRDWFADNKHRYQAHVVEPMTAFIRDIAPRLHNVSPRFNANPKPNGGSMFRIYRDVRFSKDKRPYKEHIACQFRHMVGTSAHAPGFYVHIEPTLTIVGGGIWTPPTPVLNDIRTAIAEDSQRWSAIVEAPEFIEFFGEVRGDQLKRVPKDYAAEHPFADDLRRKTFFARREIKPAQTKTTGFLDDVEVTLKTAAPLMRFLVEALGMDWR